MLRTVPPKQYAPVPGVRGKLNEVIFGVDTAEGRAFDLVLIGVISLSVLAVLLESVSSIRLEYGRALMIAEWIFTILFTIEYLLRLWCAKSSAGYAFSFFGFVDLLGTIPTYLSASSRGTVPAGHQAAEDTTCFQGATARPVSHGGGHPGAGASGKPSQDHGIRFFDSDAGCDNRIADVPDRRGAERLHEHPSEYLLGDCNPHHRRLRRHSPQTNLGQALAAVVMIMGYGIIAVPTGIVTAELTRRGSGHYVAMECSGCGAGEHDVDARFCRICGERL